MVGYFVFGLVVVGFVGFVVGCSVVVGCCCCFGVDFYFVLGLVLILVEGSC